MSCTQTEVTWWLWDSETLEKRLRLSAVCDDDLVQSWPTVKDNKIKPDFFQKLSTKVKWRLSV